MQLPENTNNELFVSKLKSDFFNDIGIIFTALILLCLLFAVCSTFLSTNSFAITIEKSLPDASQEERANNLFKEIKCLVCEGQAVHDSDSEFARSMRSLIRDQIESGKTDKQILDFVKEKYGSDILLEPPFQEETIFIWLAPFFIILTGIFTLVFWMRKQGN